MKPKAIVYIDGYNWYHAIFKHKPEWKWLNVQSFFEVLRPHDDVRMIKLFSAIVDSPSDAMERQLKFVKALKTLPKVRVILGKFQDREVTCRGSCKQKYMVPEEKKTDVNIAVEILSDGFDNTFDSMVLVSGDSDAQPPVEWIKKRYPQKQISVYIPALAQEQALRRLDFYKQIGVDCRFLPLGDILNHQLPDTLKLPSGDVICRPYAWK